MMKKTSMTVSRLTYLLSGFTLAVSLSGCLGSGTVSPSASNVSSSIAQVAKCQTPSGVSGNPTTISEAVQLLNALPKPTSIACFLEALERPFRVQATSSQVSAQPAKGARSPRIFLVRGNLVFSVVAAPGVDQHIEFGEFYAGNEAIRGSITFPVLTTLPTSAPFDAVAFGGGTGCVFCHKPEYSVPYPGQPKLVFASKIVLPDPTLEVPVSNLISMARSCNAAAEPERCAILRAVVGEREDVYRTAI